MKNNFLNKDNTAAGQEIQDSLFIEKEIILTTINAKWIHPSLALRLLKANLNFLEDRCGIIEFALRQPLVEIVAPILAFHPRILGISVSIWNHTVTLQMLKELRSIWALDKTELKPVVVLGGPEVSHLPPEAGIFEYADYVIRGEGEIAFRELCENILTEGYKPPQKTTQFIEAGKVSLDGIKNAYHLYTGEDIDKKLIYVESSRGCPYKCEFCLSADKDRNGKHDAVREFSLEPFFTEMSGLVQRGAKTFKFLDRTFNINIDRTVEICEFFLEKIEEQKEPFVVHFEMVPSLFPQKLLEILARFPPGTLRLEIGIQSLNAEVVSRIGRPSDPEKELKNLRTLREKTNAIIHADLIAGLPGEDMVSFGRGFDRLFHALYDSNGNSYSEQKPRNEIQLGILKLLLGTPIIRHNDNFNMKYNPAPPYEIEETSTMSASEIRQIKNYARFWEILVNRGLINFKKRESVFNDFIALSNSLLSHFGRNWGIDRNELLEVVLKLKFQNNSVIDN
jgi:hypothetical protein